MEMKCTSPKLKQPEITKELKISSSTLQRYRREINMVSPYRKPPSSSAHTRKQKSSNLTEFDLKMTSNNLKLTSNDFKVTSNEPVKNKWNILKAGDPIEIHFSGKDNIEEPFSSNKWVTS